MVKVTVLGLLVLSENKTLEVTAGAPASDVKVLEDVQRQDGHADRVETSTWIII